MNDQKFSFSLKLRDFDGPLDLLDALIREHKLDILDLNIAEICSQYLDYINKSINSIPIDTLSEYLSMATHLLEMKSKKILIPDNPQVDSAEFEYERDKLIQQIIEYRKCKAFATKLLDKQKKRLQLCAKTPDDIDNYATKDTFIEKMPHSISPDRLVKIFQNIVERYKISLFSQQKILVQELAVDDVEKDIMNFLNSYKYKEISFSNFLEKMDEIKISQQYIVTCFSALLELVKYRKISLFQKELDDDLYISKNIEKNTIDGSLL